MGKSPYFNFYFSDFQADTPDLSPIEKWAYVALIGSTMQGVSLPDDDERLSRICGMSKKEFKNARKNIQKFFKIIDGLWVLKKHNEIFLKIRNPKKEDVVNSVMEILLENGAPMAREKLLAALESRGIAITGSNPKLTLAMMLWRTPEIITSHGRAGYWPTGMDLPSLANGEVQ